MKTNRLSKLLCLFSSLLLTLDLGIALWSLKGEDSYPSSDIVKRTEPVAYITRSNETTYFTTIEAALKNGKDNPSKDTIYVKPGTKTTIVKDCTISSEDTLCLPFEGTTYNGRQSGSEEKSKGTDGQWRDDIGTADFADGNQESVNKYLQTNITINSNVTLTVNGNLQIGGILGTETQQLQGQTSGKYCQITMGSSSKIENHGSIDCMGYIKEAKKNNGSQVNNNSGARMYLPFVVYDYKGGKFTASVYANNTYKEFPISQYDFPNCQSKMTFEYGSEFKGYVDLFTGEVQQVVEKLGLKSTITLLARHNTDELAVIGTSKSLFELKDSSSSITIKFTPSDDNRFTTYSSYVDSESKRPIRNGSGGLTTFNLNGDLNFNSTSLSIDAAGDVKTETGLPNFLEKLVTSVAKSIMKQLNQTIETSSVDFPIPWNINLLIRSGTFTVSNKIKILGGSLVHIAKSAKLSNASKVILYDSSSSSSLYEDTLYANTIYPYEKGDAKLVNDGTIVLKSGSSFGGKISSSLKDSSIVVENGTTLEYTAHEGSGGMSISGTSVNFSFSEYKYSPIHKYACVDLLSSDGSSAVETQLVANSTYKSVESNGKIVWTKA